MRHLRLNSAPYDRRSNRSRSDFPVWVAKRLDELGTVVTGKTPATANREFYDGGDFLFVTPSDLHWNSYYVTGTRSTVTERARRYHQNQFIPRDSIMFTCIGNTIGKCGIASETCLTNQQVNSIVVHPDNNPQFVYYALIQNRPMIRTIGLSGGAAQPIINKSTFSSLKIDVPDRVMQDEIADTLSAYDDLIENNRRRIVLLEQAARELYREWFVRLRFPGYENTRIVNGLPEDWSQGRIGDLGKIVTGKTPSKRRESYYGGNVPFIKPPDLHGYAVVVGTRESLSVAGANSQANKMLPPMSILVSCIGTVGAVALNADYAHTNQQINAIVPRVDWFRYWSFFMAETLRPLLEGMGGGATMTNVSKSKFTAIKVIVPSKRILEHFDLVVSQNFDQIEKLLVMSKLLTKARNLLLPRLMSGSVTV